MNEVLLWPGNSSIAKVCPRVIWALYQMDRFKRIIDKFKFKEKTECINIVKPVGNKSLIESVFCFSEFGKRVLVDKSTRKGISFGINIGNNHKEVYCSGIWHNRKTENDQGGPYVQDLQKLLKDCYDGIFRLEQQGNEWKIYGPSEFIIPENLYVKTETDVKKEKPEAKKKKEKKEKDFNEWANGSNNQTESYADSQESQSHPLNLILYGPPGTGKTYNTVNEALKIIEGKVPPAREDAKKRYDELVENGQIVFTTFHQSMSYEDFVEGIKPITTKASDVKYEVRPGIFKRLCEKAKDDENNNYVLIIDEINRGNVSQIFGELITLLEDDKRLGKDEKITVELPYSSAMNPNAERFGVPSNLYIIGTMNTADRSVEALDTALRRRFEFKEMMPNPNLLKNDDDKKILETINSRIAALKDREHQIGHSYFMNYDPDKRYECLKHIFKNRIVPLLQEYFYGDYSKIGLVLGSYFVKPDDAVNAVKYAEGFESYFDSDKETTYRLLLDEEWENLNMSEAIKSLLNK